VGGEREKGTSRGEAEGGGGKEGRRRKREGGEG